MEWRTRERARQKTAECQLAHPRASTPGLPGSEFPQLIFIEPSLLPRQIKHSSCPKNTTTYLKDGVIVWINDKIDGMDSTGRTVEIDRERVREKNIHS